MTNDAKTQDIYEGARVRLTGTSCEGEIVAMLGEVFGFDSDVVLVRWADGAEYLNTIDSLETVT